MKNIIHIYGASGSGTSTLGKYICDKTGYFFMDTDDYFWLPTDPPYTTKRCASERIRLMREDIKRHDNVVISGSLTDWGDELIPLFTLAIRVETDTDIRLERIKAREQKRFGSRIDIGGDMYGDHIKFLNWAAAYDDGGVDMRSKAKHDAWQKQLICPLIIVDGSIPTERNFELIKDKLAKERTMKKAIIYVHGKGGNAAEAEYYKKFCHGYDVFGVDYTEYLPWIVREQIKNQYDELTKQYDEISLITNSIGTFFAMLALQDRDVKQAYCISPILNMERVITDMMLWAGVSEAELKEKKEISTDFGETLSWEYLCYVRNNPINWTVPTAVLYAGKDSLTSRNTVDEFVSCHNASLTVMENGEHWFHTKEQLEFLDEWLKKELKN